MLLPSTARARPSTTTVSPGRASAAWAQSSRSRTHARVPRNSSTIIERLVSCSFSRTSRRYARSDSIHAGQSAARGRRGEVGVVMRNRRRHDRRRGRSAVLVGVEVFDRPRHDQIAVGPGGTVDGEDAGDDRDERDYRHYHAVSVMHCAEPSMPWVADDSPQHVAHVSVTSPENRRRCEAMRGFQNAPPHNARMPDPPSAAGG